MRTVAIAVAALCLMAACPAAADDARAPLLLVEEPAPPPASAARRALDLQFQARRRDDGAQDLPGAEARRLADRLRERTAGQAPAPAGQP